MQTMINNCSLCEGGYHEFKLENLYTLQYNAITLSLLWMDRDMSFISILLKT